MKVLKFIIRLFLFPLWLPFMAALYIVSLVFESFRFIAYGGEMVTLRRDEASTIRKILNELKKQNDVQG